MLYVSTGEGASLPTGFFRQQMAHSESSCNHRGALDGLSAEGCVGDALSLAPIPCGIQDARLLKIVKTLSAGTTLKRLRFWLRLLASLHRRRCNSQRLFPVTFQTVMRIDNGQKRLG